MAKSKQKAVKQDKGLVLHSSHLLALETQQRDMENAKLRMAVEEQNLANTVLQIKILENSAKTIGQRVQALAQEFENSKKRYQTTKDEIFSSYPELKDKLAYNPLTGEIATEA